MQEALRMQEMYDDDDDDDDEEEEEEKIEGAKVDLNLMNNMKI